MGVGAGKDGGLDVPLLDGGVGPAPMFGVVEVSEIEARLRLHLLVLVHVERLRVGGAGGGTVLALGLRLHPLVVDVGHDLDQKENSLVGT